MTFHHHPPSLHADSSDTLTTSPSSPSEKVVIRRDRHGSTTAYFKASSNVNALSLEVNCHSGGEALHYGNVVDGDMVFRDHKSYDLDDDDHDDIICPRFPSCVLDSAPTLKCGRLGPA